MTMENAELLAFITRFRNLQVQRDTSETLIKVCIATTAPRALLSGLPFPDCRQTTSSLCHIVNATSSASRPFIATTHLLSQPALLSSRLTKTADASLKDLLFHCEHIETSLRSENTELLSKLNDAQLDLTDATKSRRELQQQLHASEGRVGFLTQEAQSLKVLGPQLAC